MVSIATAEEILPPIQPPEIPKNTSSAFVPPEQPGAILGIIEKNPIPPGKPDDVLGKIATADLSKEKIEEPKKETANTKPEEKADTDTKAKEAQENAEREHVKQQLKEVGTVLLRAQDVRASLVALSLAAGDTPIADEFRKQTLLMILDGEKPTSITKADWKTRKDTIKEDSGKDTSAVKKFFIDHGYPEDMFETYKKELASGIQNVMNQKDTKGNPTPTAKDLSIAMGWTDEHPMPKTPAELGKLIGPDAQNTEDMTKIFSKIQWENGVQKLKDGLKTVKNKAPNYLYFSLMAVSMLNQFVQEPEGSHGSH